MGLGLGLGLRLGLGLGLELVRVRFRLRVEVRARAGGELPAFAHGRGRSGLVVEELGNKAVDGDISIRDLAWLGLGLGGEG